MGRDAGSTAIGATKGSTKRQPCIPDPAEEAIRTADLVERNIDLTIVPATAELLRLVPGRTVSGRW